MMTDQEDIDVLRHCCDVMARHLSDGEVALVYVPKFREYGIRVLDDGSYVEIAFCPWCGMRLPSSMRDAWFDTIRVLGLEPESSDLPPAYRTDAWWRTREKQR